MPRQPRTARITITMTPEEKERVIRLAETHHTTPSDLIRQRILSEADAMQI